MNLFLGRFAGCQSICGTEAMDAHTLDLTHLKSRSMLAAGRLTNATVHLVEWITHVPELKPGRGCSSTAGSMTDVIEDSPQYLHKDDLNAIAHYLKAFLRMAKSPPINRTRQPLTGSWRQ